MDESLTIDDTTEPIADAPTATLRTLVDRPKQGSVNSCDAGPSMSARTGSQRDRSALARYGVLVAPLILVNSAAIYGQVQWAVHHLTGGDYLLAALFALTLESIAVYLAYEAHAALIAGDASFRLRAASYAAAGVVGALNYSHFAADDLRPTTAAVAFGMLSTISPWLWSIRSRSVRRDQLRTTGLIDPRGARFGAAKWVNFPLRTLRAYRWSVDHGIQEERKSWESYRAARHTQSQQHSDAPGEPRADRRAANEPAPSTPTDRQDPTSTTTPRRRPRHDDRIRSSTADLAEVYAWVRDQQAAGDTPTGTAVAQQFAVSEATGRRWLRTLRAQHPDLANHNHDTTTEGAAR